MMIDNISIKDNLLVDEKYKYLFTVEAMNQLVQKGMSYRDAYREIGHQVNADKFGFDLSGGFTTSHLGSISNPGLEEIKKKMESRKGRL
jgi:argininosuccinate lyase